MDVFDSCWLPDRQYPVTSAWHQTGKTQCACAEVVCTCVLQGNAYSAMEVSSERQNLSRIYARFVLKPVICYNMQYSYCNVLKIFVNLLLFVARESLHGWLYLVTLCIMCEHFHADSIGCVAESYYPHTDALPCQRCSCCPVSCSVLFADK